ncbi:hypothetical protein OZX69_01285 [Lactobacillus sp. ESL0731]|uniref:hypothetical protein n=1 Tax=unclassified Lactobacillus TaxID=2620435 RepID=UPI0023F8009A|nr:MULTISPECIES: hypothetical protein [unclassified Lactobacillus]WEV51387.1 hypothetical protein OZX63_01285 [Lactobacillus sp. ESL0700]WEV62517.1 hypothetical protein OZX69_01285 [Lactobacillus sp. ESL0731]
MKINKKIILLLGTVMLAGPAMLASQPAQVQAATEQTNLKINHSRVYNKYGQKLWSYRGKSSLITSKSIKVAKQVVPTTDPRSKNYSFHDENWDWYYLPYKMIKGKTYYSIGHGGYIKAANVTKINGQALLANQATIKLTKKMFDDQKANTIKVYDADLGKKVAKHFTPGQKVVVDAVTNGSDIDYQIDEGYSIMYRIKGSNQFLDEDIDDDAVLTAIYSKKDLQLLPCSKHMAILTTKNTNYYTYKGEVATQSVIPNSNLVIVPDNTPNSVVQGITAKKGRIEYATKAVYLCEPGQTEPELFYQVESTVRDGSYGLLRAADTKYIYGTKLSPLNTKEDALANKPLASTTKRAELKQLLDQAPEIRASEKYRYAGSSNSSYEYYFKKAQIAYDSLISTDTDVQKAITDLQQATTALDRGKRIKVKDINHLTAEEAKKILPLANSDIQSKYPKEKNRYYNAKFNKDYTELDVYLSDHTVNPAVTTKVGKLNIADYVEK